MRRISVSNYFILRVKYNFVILFHIYVHFFDDAYTIFALYPTGTTGNVCLGSPQKMSIIPSMI